MSEATEIFTGACYPAWRQACQRLEDAGYGASVVEAYRSASVRTAAMVGPPPVIAFADTLSMVTIKAGRRAAEQLALTAPDIASVLPHPEAFSEWSEILRRLARAAPAVLSDAVAQSVGIVQTLGTRGFRHWCEAGLAIDAAQAERRAAFFRRESAESQRLLDAAAGQALSGAQLARLRVYQQMLHGRSVPIHAAVHPPARRMAARPSFDARGMALPVFASEPDAESRDYLERAAVAHVGAHLVFSTERFAVGRQKPLKIALVSLLEDARVEALAMVHSPGLRRLWAPFHEADPDGPRIVHSLLRRLARALFDPDWPVADSWVAKAQALFHHDPARWRDPAFTLELGNRLGNDLGQMRLQFNPKGYVVEPRYRDDNLGLWLPDASEPPAETDHEVIDDTARMTDQSPNEGAAADALPQAAPTAPAPAAMSEGVALAQLAEWDGDAEVYRPGWVTIQDEAPARSPHDWLAALAERRRALMDRVDALVAQRTIGRAQRLKRQSHGDDLDIDAAIAALIDLRSGQRPDERVFQRREVVQRDLAVSVLLDTSESTRDAVSEAERLIDRARDAVAVLAHAMAGMGDQFEIQAFRSNGRDDVRIGRLKGFDEPFSGYVGQRLGGAEPGLSTRLGAAIRWAGRSLSQRAAYRRLLLVITDGEPADIDCHDADYLIEDARQSVRELAAQGMDVFGVVLGRDAGAAMTRIFGRGGYVAIDSLDQLPERLALLYFRLTH